MPSFPSQPPGDTAGDPLDSFFRRLPAPKKDAPSLMSPEASYQIQEACELFKAEIMSRPPADPDSMYILEHIERAEGEPILSQYILQRLVMLALTNGVADDDDSAKARYLRYCR
jgi:hypothetical protein